MAKKERDPVFAIRMPPELKDHLERAAEASHRSLTAEVLLRLQASFDQDDREELSARVEALEELMRELQPIIDRERGTKRNRPK